MGSVRRRIERQSRPDDPDDLREELMHRIAALLNAHRVRGLGDDTLISAGLVEVAAVLAVNASPPASEADFKLRAVNAHVEAKRQQTEEDEEEEECDDE